MIEWLLEADRALDAGRLDDAERRYEQAVAADPRNAIAMVGLARVALARDDLRTATEHIDRALATDHENAAARRHAAELVQRAAEPGTRVAPGEPLSSGSMTPVVSSPDAAPREESVRPSLLRRLLGRR